MTSHSEAPTSPTIAITGATGLIGRALSAALTAEGHQVIPVVRSAAGPGSIAR